MQQFFGSRDGLALGSGVVGVAEGLAFSGGAFPPQSSFLLMDATTSCSRYL